MARIIRNDRTEPYRIDPADFPKDGKAIWICGCGLTGKPPYCDGSHKACRQEEPGQVYLYGPDRSVVERRPDPGA